MTNQTSVSGKLSDVLVGTWQLLSRLDHNASGELRDEPSLGNDPIALLTYDRGGYFAAQFMKRERGSRTEESTGISAPNNSRVRDGYDAYFGTYTIDDEQGTVTHRLLAALSPENVDQVLVRAMQVTDNELTIQMDTATGDGEPVARTLKWRRVA